MTTGRAAAFFDRDGTIIQDVDYPRSPEHAVLLPGAAEAIARLNASAIPVVVVTNQSGIARGLLTVADYNAVRERVDELLAAAGAHIDASYMCPHHPDYTGPCDCRKPGTLLYRQAASEHGFNLAHSTYLGDRWRDVAPALELGGRGILIAGPSTPPEDLERGQAEVEVVPSLAEAVKRVLAPYASRR
jgi:D-glycero-D-manno-heptose 1,7-bisphosphate phosphatase